MCQKCVNKLIGHEYYCQCKMQNTVGFHLPQHNPHLLHNPIQIALTLGSVGWASFIQPQAKGRIQNA